MSYLITLCLKFARGIFEKNENRNANFIFKSRKTKRLDIPVLNIENNLFILGDSGSVYSRFHPKVKSLNSFLSQSRVFISILIIIKF